MVFIFPMVHSRACFVDTGILCVFPCEIFPPIMGASWKPSTFEGGKPPSPDTESQALLWLDAEVDYTSVRCQLSQVSRRVTHSILVCGVTRVNSL